MVLHGVNHLETDCLFVRHLIRIINGCYLSEGKYCFKRSVFQEQCFIILCVCKFASFFDGKMYKIYDLQNLHFNIYDVLCCWTSNPLPQNYTYLRCNTSL